MFINTDQDTAIQKLQNLHQILVCKIETVKSRNRDENA